jgi:hypothetical protein
VWAIKPTCDRRLRVRVQDTVELESELEEGGSEEPQFTESDVSDTTLVAEPIRGAPPRNRHYPEVTDSESAPLRTVEPPWFLPGRPFASSRGDELIVCDVSKTMEASRAAHYESYYMASSSNCVQQTSHSSKRRQLREAHRRAGSTSRSRPVGRDRDGPRAYTRRCGPSSGRPVAHKRK